MPEKQKKERLDVKKIFLERKRRTGWGPFSAILVTLGIYFGAQFIAAIGFGIYALQQNIDEEVISVFIENSVLAQFIFILLVEALSIYFLWIFMGRRKISWEDIGLKKPSRNNLLYAIPGFIAYFIALLFTLGVLKELVPNLDTQQEQQIGFTSATTGLDLVLVFTSLVLLPAIIEEILVRGFLYGGLVKKFSKLVAALIASAIFAVAHLQLGSGEPLLWVAAVDTFVLSMVLIWLRDRTGNIWSGVIVHLIKNSLAFISLFILKVS